MCLGDHPDANVVLVNYSRHHSLCRLFSALESSFQHHEGEEPGHGGRREEEVCDEASSGGPSGNQENLLRQLHRHLQTVSLLLSIPESHKPLF